jgi:hypothetical protein
MPKPTIQHTADARPIIDVDAIDCAAFLPAAHVVLDRLREYDDYVQLAGRGNSGASNLAYEVVSSIRELDRAMKHAGLTESAMRGQAEKVEALQHLCTGVRQLMAFIARFERVVAHGPNGPDKMLVLTAPPLPAELVLTESPEFDPQAVAEIELGVRRLTRMNTRSSGFSPAAGKAVTAPDGGAASSPRQAEPAAATAGESTTPPHPDGPEGGRWLWWQGERSDIPKGVVYRLLAFMWERASASYDALEEAGVFESAVAPQTVRSYANKANNALPHGCLWRLSADAINRQLTKVPKGARRNPSRIPKQGR